MRANVMLWRAFSPHPNAARRVGREQNHPLKIGSRNVSACASQNVQECVSGMPVPIVRTNSDHPNRSLQSLIQLFALVSGTVMCDFGDIDRPRFGHTEHAKLRLPAKVAKKD